MAEPPKVVFRQGRFACRISISRQSFFAKDVLCGNAAAMVDWDLFMGLAPPGCDRPGLHERKKKAGVAEHPEVFDHAGILVNGPPGTPALPFS